MDFLALATKYLVPDLQGKYIHLDIIAPIIDSFADHFEVKEVGKSVLKKSIYQVKFLSVIHLMSYILNNCIMFPFTILLLKN